MTRRLIIALLLMLAIAGIAAAQTSGGQMCVRGAFEDRNGNGQKDANEPPITRGLSASLMNAQGIIIDTMLMDNSPNASSGTMCFQRLEAGQYSMRVSSADYMATTTHEFIGVVSDTGIPVVFPYGGQVIPIEVPQTTDDPLALSASEQQSTFIKFVFAAIGAVVIMGTMIVVGAIIYFAFLRNRQQAMPPTTGGYAPVPSTGSYAPISDTGSYLHPSLDDTDQGQHSEHADDAAYSMYEDTDLPQARQTVAAPPNPYGDVDVEDDDFSFEQDEEDDSNSTFRPPEED